MTLLQSLARAHPTIRSIVAARPSMSIFRGAHGVILRPVTRQFAWVTVLLVGIAVLIAYSAVLAFFTLEWYVGDALNLVYLLPAYVPVALLAYNVPLAPGCET